TLGTPLPHSEVRLAVADEPVELDEGAWVAEALRAIPCGELLAFRLAHGQEATVARWSRTARRSGRTSAASRATSTTRATRTRPAPRPRRVSAHSKAAMRSSSHPGWAPR